MKALHLTSHIGTIKNIQNVFDYLNINDNLVTQNSCYNSYYMNETKANEIWHHYSDKLDEFSILIFTDTSMVARPFLQNINKHNCLIIIYVTNRFDWGIWGFEDKAYYKLYSEMSRNNRVIFCSDNNYDQYYAKTKNINFMYETAINLTPKISKNIILYTKNKFFIYNRGTKIENYKKNLIDLNINYDLFGEGFNRYNNIEHICEYKGFIHLPYQTNIQSLWENLGYFIIYFIPSKIFIQELITKTSWYYWEEKNKSYDLLIKSIELSEWYNINNKDIFEYFDSWDHLKYKIENMNDEYIIQKKLTIKNFIENSNIQNIEKWKNIIL
jgi:hypothetical protein